MSVEYDLKKIERVLTNSWEENCDKFGKPSFTEIVYTTREEFIEMLKGLLVYFEKSLLHPLDEVVSSVYDFKDSHNKFVFHKVIYQTGDKSIQAIVCFKDDIANALENGTHICELIEQVESELEVAFAHTWLHEMRSK